MHISFADLPAPSARWPATCVHMVSGNNNSEKMKNASHSLQTNGYSAIPGKLSQSRQLPGLKKKGVKRKWGPREPPDRKRVGTVTSKKGVDIGGKSKFPKAVCFLFWKSGALPVASTGARTCTARAANRSHHQRLAPSMDTRCSSPSYPPNKYFWHFKAL